MAFDAFNVTIPESQVAADAVRWQVRHRTTYHAGEVVVAVTETNAGENLTQKLWTSATGGTFTLSIVNTSNPIAYNATASQLESALEALANVRDVRVEGAGTAQDPWLIEWLNPGAVNVGFMTLNAAGLTGGTATLTVENLGVNAEQAIWTNARAGTFTLSYAGTATSALAWNATAAQVDAALDALPGYAFGNVTGSGTEADPWVATLIGANQYSHPLFEANSDNLSNPAPVLPGDWIVETFIGTEVTIAGLAPATRYEYQTRKVTTAGGQAWSSSKFATTDSVTPGLNKRPTPTGVKVSAASLAGLAVVVDEVDDRDYSWIEMNDDGETVIWQSHFRTYYGPNGSRDYPTLVAGRSYSGRIIAAGNTVDEDDSDPALWQVTIPALGSSMSVSGEILDALQLTTPTLAGVAVSSTLARLTWNAILNNAGYSIRYVRKGFTQSTTVEAPRGATSIDIDNLLQNGTFIFYITTKGEGRNEDSAESAGTEVDLTILQLTPPDDLRPLSVQTTIATLRWNRDANADSYQIRWKLATATTWGDWVTVNQPATGATVDYTATPLITNSDYDFECRSVGSGSYQTSEAAQLDISTKLVATIPRLDFSYTRVANGVSISFTNPAGRTDLRYEFNVILRISAELSTGWRIGNYSTSQSNIRVALQPGRTHLIQMIVTSTLAPGQAYRYVRVVTGRIPTPPPPTPGTPDLVQLPAPALRVGLIAGRPVVNWDARLENSQYEVRYRIDYQLTFESRLLNAGLSRFEVGYNLRAGINADFVRYYIVEVREKAPAGSAIAADSPWSSIGVNTERQDPVRIEFPAPTGVQASRVSGGLVRLDWNPVVGLTEYAGNFRIEISPSDGSSWSFLVRTSSAIGSSYQFRPAISGGISLRIRTEWLGGHSGWTVTTLH